MSWFETGKNHVWQAYTQYLNPYEPLKVARTDGVKIYLEDGREMVDGLASWWSAAHGYNHPELLEAGHKQLEKMPHVMFGGLAHEPAYELAGKLIEMTDKSTFSRVFFVDSGSVATEVMLKMALQFWQNLGKVKKRRFVAFKGGYHGDTLGAISVSGGEDGMHAAFVDFLSQNWFVNLPKNEDEMQVFEQFLEKNQDEIAGVIIEPLMQGAGGMIFHSKEALKAVFETVKRYDILFLCDECAVGFYRLGVDFAFKNAGIKPDLMSLGKALSGGVISLAAVLVRSQVFEGFLGDNSKTFMHGPTFMANPLACAISLASCKIFERENYQKKVVKIEQILRTNLSILEGFFGVLDVRFFGAVGAVELDSAFFNLIDIRKKASLSRVWLRPLMSIRGTIILYTTPPLVINESDLCLICDEIKKILNFS
jgi:adenosylmethionine-8-amino-7-oxononanoate aminotransferase